MTSIKRDQIDKKNLEQPNQISPTIYTPTGEYSASVMLIFIHDQQWKLIHLHNIDEEQISEFSNLLEYYKQSTPIAKFKLEEWLSILTRFQNVVSLPKREPNI